MKRVDKGCEMIKVMEEQVSARQSETADTTIT